MDPDSRGKLPPYKPSPSDVIKQFENLNVSSVDCPLPFPLAITRTLKLAPEISNFVGQAFAGLKAGKKPYRSHDGEGGTYWLLDPSGKYVAVFKPEDEEPNAINNPNRPGISLSVEVYGLRKGIKAGRGALREILAYLFDHPWSCRREGFYGDVKGFGGVPPTIFAKCMDKNFYYSRGFECKPENIKTGSLQKYEENDGSCMQMGSANAPVEEVHKITLLDIRYANTDRHAGNILSRMEDGKIKLIPIDHGYCFPGTVLSAGTLITRYKDMRKEKRRLIAQIQMT